jgi:hypothetical protein
MTTERLDVRLDPERRQKLRDLAGAERIGVSEVIRRLIDAAYEARMLERRLLAVKRISEMAIEEMPDPDELSRQLNETYRAGGID